MPPVGLEPTVSADERPQTYGLDRAANWTRKQHELVYEKQCTKCLFNEGKINTKRYLLSTTQMCFDRTRSSSGGSLTNTSETF